MTRTRLRRHWRLRDLEERITPAELLHTLYPDPTGPQDGAQFGASVATGASFRVVGAPQSSVPGLNGTGQAFVYEVATNKLVATLNNPTPGAADIFGKSVAVSSNYVVVGAPQDSTGVTGAGSAYVYDLSSVSPTIPVATLNNPTPANNDRFGDAVAVSGKYVVIGASRDDTLTNGAGAAYVYDLSSSTPTTPIIAVKNPTPEGLDYFGASIALSGSLMVVGAYGDNTGSIAAGSAYVYDLGSKMPTSASAILNNPAPANYDNFGWSVAVSGNYVVVGAWNDGDFDIGTAYVYDLGSMSPTVPFVTLDNPTPASSDWFGYSVTVSGNAVVVGAKGDNTGGTDVGSAYVYDLNSKTPTVPIATLNNPTPLAEEYFGYSVAVSGNNVLVGASNDFTEGPKAGSTYLYDLTSKTLTVPIANLSNPTSAAFDYFGASVAVSAKYMVVGASGDDTGVTDAGAAVVYDLSSTSPTAPVAILPNPRPAKIDFFGDSFGAAVAVSGNYVVVGAGGDDSGTINTGSAYVYDLASSTPTTPMVTLKNPTPAGDDYFGGSVAISGKYVVIGSDRDDTVGTDAGSAYIYDLSSMTPSTPIITLNNPSPGSYDYFGHSLAVSGTYVVVGAWYDDAGVNNAGTAYVYDLSSKTPTLPFVVLNNPSPTLDDLFSNAVTISGTYVVVGAYQDDSGKTDTGTAYVYDLNSGTPSIPFVTLSNPTPANYDFFGSSVAISGHYIVIGASSDDNGATDAGSAYVYDLSSLTMATPVAVLNNPMPMQSDFFGNPVAIAGKNVVVGVPRDDDQNYDQGSARVYSLVDRDAIAHSLIHDDTHKNVSAVPLGSTIHGFATVTGLGPTPTGTVTFTFSRDNAPVGVAGPEDLELAKSSPLALVNGSIDAASFTQGPLAAGNYYFTAAYSGDGNYTGSTSPIELLTVNKAQLVITTAVHDAVHKAITTADLGASVHAAASISGAVAGFPPTAAVSFTKNGAPFLFLAAEGKMFRSVGTGPLGAGVYTFASTVAGDDNYEGATSNVAQLTIAGEAAVSIGTEIYEILPNDSLPHVVSGGSVGPLSTIYAAGSVYGSEPDFPPTGTVTFSLYNSDDGTGPTIGTEVVSLPVNGVIDQALITKTLTAGDYSYRAQYSGDNNYAAGAGPVQSLYVIGGVRFTVDAIFDEETDTDGKMSLREAILAANKTAIADSVELDATLFGTPQTILLTLGEIPITKPVAIVGRGAALTTISGGKASRLFNVTTAPGGTVIAMSGLTLTAGKATGSGGAILATNQRLILNSCQLTNNVASGSGGAISITDGVLDIDSSTFVDNVAVGDGGAIEVAAGPIPPAGVVGTLVNSTFVGNKAAQGGAVKIKDTGPNSVVITACTIVDNSATAGGGGVNVDPAGLVLVSSIVYGNVNGGVPNDLDVSAGSTLDYSYSDVGVIANAGSVTGKSNISIDPLLGQLANNGGPTLTRVPMRGSPLINAGLNVGTQIQIYDQRGIGVPRVSGGVPDIGAVESKYLPGIRSIVINEGAVQRSRVTSIEVVFDTIVVLPTSPGSAFQLVRQGDGAMVALAASVANMGTTVVTLTFPGNGAEFDSLTDGRYTLTVLASQISSIMGALDGNGDGTAGDDFALIGSPANGLYRLFGDADGDGDVDTGDFGQFRSAFGGSTNVFDFDNDGDVDTTDFGQFRARFGTTI